MIEDELPPDPDLDFVDPDLRLLAGLNGGRVVVLDESGVSHDQLMIAPSLFRRAREIEEGELGASI